MGVILDIKKEWTWSSIKQNWPDLLSIGAAVFFADGFREKGFLIWAGIWLATYIASVFLLRFIARYIKGVK